MSGTRANIIKIRGLVTNGSEITRPEGSQRIADNVNIDEDGVISPRRGFNDYNGPTTGSETTNPSDIVTQIMEYKDAIIRKYSTNLEYEDSTGTFQPVNGSYTNLREGFRTKWIEASSNLYFTTDEGIKKISAKNRSDLNINMVEDAGAIKAGFGSGKVVPTVGGFLPAQSKVAYRFIFGKKDNNGNLIEGTPSERFVVTNYSTSTSEFAQVKITFSTTATTDEIENGDHYVLTLGDTKYTIYYDATGDDTAEEPKTSETIGSSYIKVSVFGNTADNGNLAAITANVIASSISGVDVTIGATNEVLITSTTEGQTFDKTDPRKANSDPATSRIQTSLEEAGSTQNGDSANIEITGSVPSNASTDYFYQVYRTGPISVSDGLTINDIDPGDEMNIVYESGLTQPEITAGEFTFTDNTPDSFRAEAAPLYTNEVTGDGILQANEAPPIALDLALFRNYTFYANTKTRHKLEFNMVSIDNFISGSTRFIIGNGDTTRYYTFVGTAEVTDVTIDALPSDGDYINIYSANDERQYYIYFGDTDPDITGAVGYKIKISDTPTTDEVASRIETALLDNVDFELSVAGSVITFTHTNNGFTTGITNGIGTDITIAAPSTDGTGESPTATPEGGDVLLSGLVSTGQSIDETARSLVKMITKDPNSPVNAFYLSTTEDLPGNILLEARSLEDQNFYIAIEEPSDDKIGDEFTPQLPLSKSIEKLDVGEFGTIITQTAHGYTEGQQLFIGYLDEAGAPNVDSFSGIFTVNTFDSLWDSGTAYTEDTIVYFNDGADDRVYRALQANTNSQPDTNPLDWEDLGLREDLFFISREVSTNLGIVNSPAFTTVFSADVESDNEELSNRIYYSKRSQPEAVPTENFIDVGPQDAEIKRILALRDNLFVLKDDGIYVVSGTSAPDWSVRLIDSTRIIAPDSAVVLNNQIYCLTEQGITRISGSGAAIISRGIEDQIDAITRIDNFADNTFGIAFENDRCYIMFCPSDNSDTYSTKAFRFNMFEQTWSTWTYNAKCGLVLDRDNVLYLGNGDRNYISKQRRNGDRTDHADRNFTRTINTRGVSGNILELSTLVDIKINDAIVQKQDVSVYYFNNRLLKKMDLFDTGANLGSNGGVITYPDTSTANFFTPYPHRLENGSTWTIRITTDEPATTNLDYVVTVIDDNNFQIDFDSSSYTISEAIFKSYFFRTFGASAGDNMPDKVEDFNNHLNLMDPANITSKVFTYSNIKVNTELLVDELNTVATFTKIKTYKKPDTVYYEAYIQEIDVLRNQVTINSVRPFVEGDIEVYKGYSCKIEWNPQHFGDPSALKQIRYATIMFDQNNFNEAIARFSSDAAQAIVEVPFKGKGIGYWGDLSWSNPNHYWGGIGNDIPFRNPVPRGKQKCRYLTVGFEHRNARESFKILGISAVVRAISDRAYR